MARVSKKYARNKDKKPSAPLGLEDALSVLKKFEGAKFDESVELAVKLGIDPKNTNQIVRGAFSLPYGIGKDVRVVAFADGEAAKAAEEAGADVVGGEDLAKRIVNAKRGEEEAADEHVPEAFKE